MTADGNLLQQALALHQQGALAPAAALYDRILAVDPFNFEALQLRGALANQLGQYDAAARLLTRALALNNGHPVAQYNCGLALMAQERLEAALGHFNRAVALRPHYVKAFNNRGVVLAKLKRPAEALASYDKALAFEPGNVEALANRGAALMSLGRLEEAVESANAALAAVPENVGALYNRANALGELHAIEDALAGYARVLTLQPEHAEAQLNQALVRLMAGDYTPAAWEGYEWRWRNPQQSRTQRNFPQAQWLGEDITGKTILLHAEQGFGDSIQFCRYAPLVTARGARVVLEVQRPLLKLMGSLAGVAEIVAAGDALPAFDVHCPLLSLPRAFQTSMNNVPADVPYLRASDEALSRWRAELGERNARRIGLVWAGNREHGNDAQRSVALDTIAPLFANGAAWFSLQKDLRPGDAELLTRYPVLRHVGDALKDFDDTAAVVSLMDMVVTVDTAMAHVAGALAKDVRILLPRLGTDWRWMIGCEDNPWYPTAKLYRQEKVGDWRPALARLAAELL